MITTKDELRVYNEYGETIVIRDGQAFHSDCDWRGGSLCRLGWESGGDFLGALEVNLNSEEADLIESHLDREAIIRFEKLSKSTRLSNSICPICWKKQSDFDRHHVVWRYEGGKNVYWNLLMICADCHALLTFGGSAGGLRNRTAVMFAQSQFGLLITIHGTRGKSKREQLLALISEHGRRTVHLSIKKAAQITYRLLVRVHQHHLEDDVIETAHSMPKETPLCDICLVVLTKWLVKNEKQHD